MARRTRTETEPEQQNAQHYEYIRAVRDAEGNLRFEYKLNRGLRCEMSHDEDVSDWSNRDTEKCARSMLSVDKDDPVKVEVLDE